MPIRNLPDRRKQTYAGQAELDTKEKEAAVALVKGVQSADPNSEEFLEERIALLSGRDLEGRPLPQT
jgi:hypothetical protein